MQNVIINLRRYMRSIGALSSKLDKKSKKKLNAERQNAQNSQDALNTQGNPDETYRDIFQSASDNQNVSLAGRKRGYGRGRGRGRGRAAGQVAPL